MNIKEYISSGILEQYLLGNLTSQEEKQVEQMMSKHPEIRQEMFSLSDTLEKMAMQSAIEPPQGLKDSILKEIDPKHIEHRSVPKSGKKGQRDLILPALIASLLGLCIVGFIAYSCFRGKTRMNEQIESQNTQIQTLSSENQDLNTRLESATQNLNIMTGGEYNQVIMRGLPISPQSFAQVFWNESTSDVYLSPSNLPTPESGKQYQLWAIVDGAPVSMGVFDLPETDFALIKMNSIANAATFAITLEPQGGVESPTLEAMYVAGNVNS
ncbi:MAG: anti-sigma factor [Saprospiraceae bacterium]|nr:anti-sigma factor [Saprospiraceae bacterium]